MHSTAAFLVLALLAFPATAEITSGSERPRDRGQTPARVVGNELTGTIGTRCWQEGREILAEADFATASIPPGLREQAINLAGQDRQAVLLPLGDTFCLLTVRP